MPLPTTALRGAAPVGVADAGVVGAWVEVGGAMLVSRVVDGSSVVLGAAVVDSAVELGFSDVDVDVDVVVGSGLVEVEVDRALVAEVVGAVEIWETLMVVVDFSESSAVLVGSEAEMLMVASPSPVLALDPAPLATPPEMVKGLEYWNCSGLETSSSLIP